ncbi:dipeptidase-7 [Coleophoma cylindrospora]|uniref:Dipeptidase n=1 Tax=Coleophoma cylindrospora TaxID=1849047 RepID=A0A3D8SSK5_9HELO|nr:dipeptidase-7 [Coleophoma cylindrospora]
MSQPPKTQGSHAASTLKWLSIISVPLLAIGSYLYLSPSVQQQQKIIDPLDFRSRAEYLMNTTPLIDGHNDLPYLLRLELKNKIYDGEKFDFREGLASHTDLARLKQGKIGGQFWSVFVECPSIEDLDDPNHNVRDTLEQIDVAKRLFDTFSSSLHYCTTSACAISAFKDGRIASMLGAEGLHQATSSIATIRQFYNLGVRYITLTHNCDNPFAIAASSVTAGAADTGLTEFGVQAVKEMNRLGMMVDLSHVSHKTMSDVLDIAKSPVMFSHAACFALARNYRNVPDEVLSRLRVNGGVVMVFFVKRFLNAEDPESADLDAALDHIFHVVDIAGWDHVGIGADFDGTITLANGIDDVSAYPNLIEGVLRRGATDEQVRKLLGENILRVWAENEKVAERLQGDGMLPVEEVWDGRKWSRWDNPLPVMIPGNPDRIRAENYI